MNIQLTDKKITYLSKLLEAFPGTRLAYENDLPNFCPDEIGLKDIKKCRDDDYYDNKICIECWNQEYQEAQND